MYRHSDLERAMIIMKNAETVWRHMWSAWWPKGHCLVTSVLLNPVIRAAVPSLDTRIVIGQAFDCRRHAWIESTDGAVFDPTYGQFVPGRIVEWFFAPAHHASTLPFMGERALSLDEEERARRSIDPCCGSNGGWCAGTHVKDLWDSCGDWR